MSESEKNLVSRSLFRVPSFVPNLWDDMMDGRLGQWIGEEANTGISISEDDKHVYVEAHLPGLKSEEIDISLNKNTLWIRGEKEEKEEKEKKYYRRARSSFFYQVDLPSHVEESSEHADFDNGILKISFTKALQNQVRKIAVKGVKPQESTKPTIKKKNGKK